ncbi:uncharacterized protein LOC108648193 isoform X2 [Xenopus tropicalis]|uniref:Uncharacterized protein LOC108648193 isoform X2 n=1 Tax=Xenopus tropicalis TaxID=8364 RepID=A0A8J1J2U1_XENTR|nr:uncharacterized protein LOC108648197 isoform X2 [Xenopus tropicalis]XP_031751350.1 uncharacterized protein LOC108648193 isoform X2 [Xenopus tropicalis]
MAEAWLEEEEEELRELRDSAGNRRHRRSNLNQAAGRYSHEDIWSTQPVCLPNDVNYNVEGTVSCVMRDPAPAQNSRTSPAPEVCPPRQDFLALFGPLGTMPLMAAAGQWLSSPF